MKTKFGRFSLFGRLGKDERKSSPRLLVQLLRDEAGSYLLYMTLLMPILIGAAGLGTEDQGPLGGVVAGEMIVGAPSRRAPAPPARRPR